MLATTATANQRVTDDVAEQLGARRRWCCAARSTASRCGSGWCGCRTAEQRLAWLADHLAEQPGVGIVYCLTVAATQEVADYLRSRGHAVAAYSGQTEPTERLALEQDLLDGRVKALVATSALGMGFDATLGFVVNLGAPAVAGRLLPAGRPRRPRHRPAAEGRVVLLPAIEDRDIWAYFASLAFPREELVRETLDALADHGAAVDAPRSRRTSSFNRNRLETMLKVLDVDGAVRRVRGGWEATGQEWAYDAERYRRVAEAREREQQAMLAYLDTDGCRMRFLRDQLDDPGGRAAAAAATTAAGSTLSDRGAAPPRSRRPRRGWPGPAWCVEPRKMWPTALANLGIDLKGKIADGADGGPGRRPADRPRPRPGAARAVRAGDDGPVAGAAGPGGGRGARRLAARRPTRSSTSSPRPGRRSAATSPRGCPLPRRTRSPRRFAIVDPVGRARPRRGQLRPAGGGGRPAASRCRATSRPGRCCWSTTWSSPAGPLTLAARALREAGATDVLPLALGVSG